MRSAPAIKLSDGERAILERWARGRSTPARLVLRSRIVLLASQGWLNKDIAGELRCATKTVGLWRARFAERRVSGIEKDAERGGNRKPDAELLVRRIVHMTLHTAPPRRSRWTTRSLAKALGTSPATVQRVWKAHNLTAYQRPRDGAP